MWPWPLTLKIIRHHPLVIRRVCTKFGSPSWNGSVCIMFTSFGDRPTDGRTYGCPHHYIILHKWFVTSKLIGWWRSHGCSAFFRYCTVNSLVLNLWRQWRRRRWRRRTKMASTVRRIRGDRTELGADRMWGERVWGEPALGRNVWHPGIIFEELSLVDPKSRPWKTPVPKGKAKGGFL